MNRKIQVVAAITVMGLCVFGMLGLALYVVTGLQTVPGTIISQNNQWESDGYTYTNYTVSLNGQIGYLVTHCNYYHVNSTVRFSDPKFYFWAYPRIDEPWLVQGC